MKPFSVVTLLEKSSKGFDLVLVFELKIVV